MKAFHCLLSTLLVVSALAAPAGFAQAPLADPPANQDGHDHQEIDPKLLIKAQAAYALLKSEQPPLVIDVRSRPEFNAEHIQGAISYPYTTIKTEAKYPFAKERKLLLYCGCPHHLSGLSAEILKQRGYPDVVVIDEGYWGWKAMGLPIMRNPNAPKQVSMSVSGQVRRASGTAAAFKDIFLLHPASGQLEATRTDREGRFTMHLHFGGVASADVVRLSMDDLTLNELTLGELGTELMLELPERQAGKSGADRSL